MIACRKTEGEYVLGLFNNDLHARPWSIESRCGAIQSITELSLGQSEKGKPGYWPTGRGGNDGGKSDDRTIAGGDVRLFSVRVREKGVKCLPTAEPPARPVGRRLSVRPSGTIQEAILQRPTFFQHCDGVKVDWTYLRQREAAQLEREGGWLARQQARIIVDFSPGCNFYPDLAMVDTFHPRYEESMAAITDVFSKMPCLNAQDAVISLHRRPDDHSVDERRADERFLAGVRDLCRRAATHGVTVHVQVHPNKWHGGTDRMLRFIEEVGQPNLRYALSTGHTAMLGENLKESLAMAGSRLGVILLSAPRRDLFNQTVDAHAPVAGAEMDLKPLRAYRHICQVLDADYRNLDEEYLDCQAVWQE